METFTPYPDENNVGSILIQQKKPKNTHAIASFVLSLFSIIIMPLIIPQIVSIVLGIIGLKLDKRGFAIAGIIISSITILMGIVAIIAIGIFSNVLSNAKDMADQDTAKTIQLAIASYVYDTGDTGLTMGGNGGQSVESLIKKLKSTIVIDGSEYGPYLDEDVSNDYKPVSSKYNGWEITLDKAGKLFVKPSTVGDQLLIE